MMVVGKEREMGRRGDYIYPIMFKFVHPSVSDGGDGGGY